MIEKIATGIVLTSAAGAVLVLLGLVRILTHVLTPSSLTYRLAY